MFNRIVKTVCLPFHLISFRRSFKYPILYRLTEDVRMQSIDHDIKYDLQSMFQSAISSVLPNNLIRNALTVSGQTLEVGSEKYHLQNNCYIVGFGKAVLGMAYEAESILHEHLIEGVISIPFGMRRGTKSCSCSSPKTLKVIEGAKNNIPDENAREAANMIGNLAKNLDASAILVVLISGGGSALLPCPKSPITLQEKVDVCNMLVANGATIQELNCVRKKLSELKGGGLAKLAYPAQVIALILSDIVGDPLDYIASGPTVFNTDPPEKALHIVQHYGLEAHTPSSVLDILNSPYDSQCEVSVNSGSFKHVQNIIVGNNKIAIDAAKREALKRGYEVVILSTEIQAAVGVLNQLYISLCFNICKYLSGQCPELENYLQEILDTHNLMLKSQLKIEILSALQKFPYVKGICLLSGGETTVMITGKGRGGRNQELALRFSINMFDLAKQHKFLKNFRIVMLSAGTDGIDGPTDAAGAFGCENQIQEANKYGLSPEEYVANNDSNGFYTRLSDGGYLFKTGHTGTNVMDVHSVVIQSVKHI